MKLFELIVIRDQLKGQSNSTTADLKNTFDKKRHHFESKVKTFTPLTEGAQTTTEEESAIQTTVDGEIKDFLRPLVGKYIDTCFQVAHGNQVAKADVKLEDGTVILRDVPATALLDLENRLEELRSLFKSIPTLDPAKGFEPDPARPEGTFKAREVTKTRTKKIEDFVVVVQPTKEHPAQIAKITKDIDVGTIREQEWSSLITPARKSEILERTEELLRVVKQAAQRANDVELTSTPKCNDTLFGYILTGSRNGS
jgi:hypothetical protein